jgi:polysaccharide chain length determinant protein (PEP-CTERM system associated)
MAEQQDSALIDYYVGLVMRKRWLVIVPFCIAMAVGIILSFKLPTIYEASTLILVEAQRVPSEYVKSIVSTDIESRINTISQQILSRSALEKIISDFKLFSGSEQQGAFMEDKLNGLRKRIKVEVNRGRQNLSSEAFTIAFQGDDPQKTMNIANALASYFIDANLKIREEQASGTSSFLDAELDSMKRRLEEVEGELREFRNRHMGELPEQLDANLRIIGTLEAQLNSRMERLRDDRSRLAIANNEADQAQRAERVQPTIVPSQPAQSLSQLKEQLASMETTYTPKHPDVIRLKKMIEELEVKEKSRERDTAPAVSSSSAGGGAPVYREKTRRRMEVEATIANAQEDIAHINSQIKEYRRRIEMTPKREEQLLTFNRDYENIKNTYNSLLNRKLEADIAVNLEKKKKGEQFRIIDYAKMPEKPISPDLQRLFLMLTAGGLGAGFGIIFLLDMLNGTIRRPLEIESGFSIRVLATIPRVQHSRERFLWRLNVAFTAVAVVVASMLCAGFGMIALAGIQPTLEFIRRFVTI